MLELTGTSVCKDLLYSANATKNIVAKTDCMVSGLVNLNLDTDEMFTSSCKFNLGSLAIAKEEEQTIEDYLVRHLNQTQNINEHGSLDPHLITPINDVVFLGFDSELLKMVIGAFGMKSNHQVPQLGWDKCQLREFEFYHPMGKNCTGCQNRAEKQKNSTQSQSEFSSSNAGQKGKLYYNGCFSYLITCRLHLDLSMGIEFLRLLLCVFDSYDKMAWFADHMRKCHGIRFDYEQRKGSRAYECLPSNYISK